MTPFIRRKPFYRIAELCVRWSLNESDIASFVLAEELTLSIAVSQLPVLIKDYEEIGGDDWAQTGSTRKRMSGTLDLHRDNAWQALTLGSAAVTAFKTSPDRTIEYELGEDGAPLHIEVQSLVVRREEIERFEGAQAMTAAGLTGSTFPLSAPPSGKRSARGAPGKYDVDDFWRETVRTVHIDGVPARQTELVLRLQQWFERQSAVGKGPDESWIRKKFAPLWPDIAPEVRPERRAR